MTELRRSWVESANSAATLIPLNSLPCGVFSVGDGAAHCGVAIVDTLTLKGATKGDGYQIGFGTCAGTILPALIFPT